MVASTFEALLTLLTRGPCCCPPCCLCLSVHAEGGSGEEGRQGRQCTTPQLHTDPPSPRCPRQNHPLKLHHRLLPAMRTLSWDSLIQSTQRLCAPTACHSMGIHDADIIHPAPCKRTVLLRQQSPGSKGAIPVSSHSLLGQQCTSRQDGLDRVSGPPWHPPRVCHAMAACTLPDDL